MKKERLAIIGAGEAALPIINKAKIMDIETIAFARLDSIAKDSVDIFIEENNFDIDFICQKCKELGVNGVIASSELTTEVTAKVAHQLGLPGNDVESGFAGKNKYLMRCKVSNIKTVKQPKFELYTPNKKYEFPIIVKAVDSCGKRGVSLVKNERELEDAINYAKKYSSNGDVLIEEYLVGGQEYSIECLCGNGYHCVIQYTQKDSAGAPHFVEIGHHQPASFSNEMRTKVKKASQDILKAIGINCGMAHLELKIINKEIYFIEVGARAAGGHIADTLIPLSTNFDYFKGAIECCLNRFYPSEIKNTSYAGLYYYCKQNEKLAPLFNESSKNLWCADYHFKEHKLDEVICNTEAMASGYIIYHSDKKIDLCSYEEESKAIPVELNNFSNAYTLIWKHYKRIDRNLSNSDLDSGIRKSLQTGHVIAILFHNEIIAYALLYLNHKDSLDGYICNGYVFKEYRGKGLFPLIFKKAFEISREYGFKSLSLDVDKHNERAIYVYKKVGFNIVKEYEGKFLMRYFFE